MKRRAATFLTALMITTGVACNEVEDCADCPNLSLQPACLEAAAACDAVGGEERRICLEEARQLCE